MKAKLSIIVLLVLSLIVPLVGAVGAHGPQGPLAAAALHSSPVMFIQNDGQFGEGAHFQVRGGDRTLWLADDGLWMTELEKPASPLPERPSLTSPPEFGVAGDEGLLPSPTGRGAGGEGKGVHLKLTFPGANPHPRLEPFNRLETSVNYLLGNDPAQWRTNVPVWGGVRYVDLYPGIDLEISGESGHLVQRLVCRANCQFALQDVQLRVEGAERVALLSGAGGEGFAPLALPTD